MKIEMTKEQYQKLLELLYVGGIVINGDNVEPVKDYDEVQQYIYSFSKDYKCEDIVKHDSTKNSYLPAMEFENKMMEFVEDYCEDDFVENLVIKLSKRDAIREYGLETLEKMDLKDRMHAVMKYECKYYNEIKENGLENFKVNFK